MLIPAQSQFAWQEAPPSIERAIGDQVADACGAIARALMEYQNGGLTTGTKMHGGDLIAQLYALRQYMVGTWDFDAMAREYGKLVLRERCGNDVSEATIDELVAAVLDILAKVVRSQLH
jgi:hypothetical protein